MGTIALDVPLQFRMLFGGRQDVWGAVHGECVESHLTDQDWRNHLYLNGSIGIYPLTHVGLKIGLKWGCTDIDSGYDMIAQAANIWRVLKALGIHSYVERTKGKGYHVWVFASEWMDPEPMRRMFLFAHQIADVPAKEVNPKQTSLEGLKGYGNYVNLPYARSWVLQGKRVVLDMEYAARIPWSLDEFMAKVRTNAPTAIEAVAARYVPPPPPKHVFVGVYDGDLVALTSRMSGLTHVIFQAGPMDGSDRSSKLMQLCYLMRDDEFTADEALALLRVADERWGKFAGRPDCEIQLTKMIERAFG